MSQQDTAAAAIGKRVRTWRKNQAVKEQLFGGELPRPGHIRRIYDAGRSDSTRSMRD